MKSDPWRRVHKTQAALYGYKMDEAFEVFKGKEFTLDQAGRGTRIGSHHRIVRPAHSSTFN